jgi:hypothetical protein
MSCACSTGVTGGGAGAHASAATASPYRQGRPGRPRLGSTRRDVTTGPRADALLDSPAPGQVPERAEFGAQIAAAVDLYMPAGRYVR